MSRFVFLLERFPVGVALAARRMRALSFIAIALLATGLVDELTFGLREAAWPQVRDDLSLSYGQIGLILGIPGVTSAAIEVWFGALADMGYRRRLILGGGALFSVSIIATALSQSFWPLLIATMVLYPASGAFVSVSQAALMDSDPKRHEQNMARWTFAGSIGIVGGSLLFAGGAYLGIGWRPLFLVVAAASLLVTLMVARARIVESESSGGDERLSLRSAMTSTARQMRRGPVLRWMGLLSLSDLMLDVLHGFLALYFVDVVGASAAQGALAVTVWTGVGLVGDFALIPLLERVNGVKYLRISAALTAIVFAALLLVPGLWPKLVLLGALGFLNAGWYSVLQARLYSEIPGRSGAVVSISVFGGSLSSLWPLALGMLAGAVGLEAAMWALLVSPALLFLGLPRGADSPLPAGEGQGEGEA